ncbi:sporulation integral membrane protein YlbJ [Caldicoprobacter guelmensis]|uniref:sporulation integral membrane protein YlbJ n=1 Tax=Caldicoprobacter guelmensis TaxID=1170224 RepID=UPI00195BD4BD|nr:sporulation integral membrane protein YlbJ [Caldicoprobacter guelmensis]MBM7581914.1 sporulation integral membrane protein YlbJ [Caldicoprobacter guelmensis]
MQKKYALSTVQSITLVTLCLLVGGFLLAFPQQSLQAALIGLDTWLKNVFPALLPFFITSEMMIALGLVDFFAVLLRPVMKPLFRCSGKSSFIWAMSITSGYPVGAKLTASFLEKGDITVHEAQRIMAFCSTSGPLFMLGAVGVGMLNSSAAGKVIAASHYIASIIVGLLFRFYIPSGRIKSQKTDNPPTFKEALSAMLAARKKDSRTLGEMLGDAVRNSMNTLLYIGGFIILFSVIINILLKINLINAISQILMPFILPLGIRPQLLPGLIGGIFEMTAGCKLISQTIAPLPQKIILSAFVISWSGFSIHCQVMGFLSRHGLSLSLYMKAKLLHGILASTLAWGIMKIFPNPELDAFYPFAPQPNMSFSGQLQSAWQWVLYCILSLTLTALVSLITRHLNPSRHSRQ